jgi:serine/threonine protein kinase/Tfp pilus assembly protein PilF
VSSKNRNCNDFRFGVVCASIDGPLDFRGEAALSDSSGTVISFSLSDAESKYMIGQVVSHYRILAGLAKGGMGEVYLAEDTNLGRRVAIKFPMLESNERDFRARFLREARAVSELSNPHIATVFDYGETSEGRPFLVMEYVSGRTLNKLVRKGQLTVLRVLEIIEAVASALDEAHSRGIVHRDIKPSNIMVDDRGQVKVLDFGLAKQINEDKLHESEPEAQTLLAVHTRSGAMIGTPAYLSPEQAMGQNVDGRADLFALGGVFYECVTGQAAFPGTSLIEIAANVLHFDPPPPSSISPSVPPELDAIILKALSKNPDKRYQSAAELISDVRSVRGVLHEELNNTLMQPMSSAASATRHTTLTNFSQMLRRPRVPVWYILVGVAVVLVAALVFWRWWKPAPHIPPDEARNWYEVGTNALRDGSFYQASKALEQAISIDDKYAVAHARLADSLIELDYLDRAKDELLRAASLASDRSLLPRTDALYIDAISATGRHDYLAAIESYAAIVKQSSDAEKPRVLVDFGRAYEKNDDIKKAIDAYTEAANRNPRYATPFLRLGVLYGRQRDLPNALTAFDKADQTYQALGNLEGRTEVAYQRGALFNQLGKLSDAKAQLEQALTLAAANNNTSQKIKALLQLSTVAVDAGQTAQATDYARDAVDLAQKNGMENLSAQGLTDLGYSFLVRGQPDEAEKYFLQSLESAQRVKARSNEARARGAMASLRQQQNRPDEVIQYLEPALTFYQQAGYRSAASSCLALLARADLQKGDYPAAEKAHEQLLKLGQELGDQSMIALAHAELASALARQEKFTAALDHLTQAYAIYDSQGVQRSMGYNLVERALVLGSLGRYGEVERLLNQAASIADKPGGEIKRLSLEAQLVGAEIALTQNHSPEARDKSEKLLAQAAPKFPEISMNATWILGMAMAYGGTAAGKQKCAEAVELAKQLNDRWQSAKAQLALAEALLVSGDAQGAANTALQARQTFAQLGHQASEWRALVLAALAWEKLGDKSKAQEYAVQSNESLSKLEQIWGKENRDSFLSRPDIQRLRKQLEQVTSAGR